MANVLKFKDIDLYKLLKIETTASENEIRRAYRKKALSCHPDKNPNNPKATGMFHQLSDALKILTDKSSRAEYDFMLNAEKAKRKLFEDFDRFFEQNDNLNKAAKAPKTDKDKGKSPEEKDETDRLRREKAELRAQKQLFNKRKKLIKDVRSAYAKSIAHLKRSEAQLFKNMERFDPKLFADLGPTYVKVIENMKGTYAKSIEKLKRTNAELIEDFAESIENLKGFNVQ